MTIAQGPHDAGRRTPLEPELEELRARLDADLRALVATITGLSQAQADWRPAVDRWSIGEVLHHLVLSNRLFALAVGRLVKRGRSEGLLASPGGRRSWPRLRAVTDARASGPIKNPDRVTPTHRLPVDELQRELIASHTAVANRLPDLAGLDLAALRLPHPFGFELNLYQWADIAGAHERRHLAQIEAVKGDPAFPVDG
jgi:hypothetical protein